MQASVCADVEALDGSGVAFIRDAWTRPGEGSGFGVTRVLEGGDVFEKAAANVSIIRGVLTPERAAAMSARGRPGVDPAGGQPYAAAALSLVFHPRSPMVPTFRADVRRFTVDGTSWFGGGADHPVLPSRRGRGRVSRALEGRVQRARRRFRRVRG